MDSKVTTLERTLMSELTAVTVGEKSRAGGFGGFGGGLGSTRYSYDATQSRITNKRETYQFRVFDVRNLASEAVVDLRQVRRHRQVVFGVGDFFTGHNRGYAFKQKQSYQHKKTP
jgi:hypothetical protein